MQQIIVHIKEKDKGARNLSLLNLREEVVNFLYKDTVAYSTKSDMQFYILIYFASLRLGDKSFLERILDEAVPKFDRLNQSFTQRTGYLRAREYRALVDQHDLTEVFKNDIFFVLLEAILNIEGAGHRFTAFYEQNGELKQVIAKIKNKYAEQLRKSLARFSSSKIEDDRYDEYGNYHDLSKSVYRTVRMRNARNLDLNLQRYTSVRLLTSQSPVDLNFIQYVDPQIIFDLWTKYHLAEYMRHLWREINDSPIMAGTVSGVLAGLIVKHANWQSINGQRNRKEKNKAKREFDQERQRSGQLLDDLTLRLVDSVLNTNERLEQEIKRTRRQINDLTKRLSTAEDPEIKRLRERLERLENLEVDAHIEESEEKSEDLGSHS